MHTLHASDFVLKKEMASKSETFASLEHSQAQNSQIPFPQIGHKWNAAMAPCADNRHCCLKPTLTRVANSSAMETTFRKQQGTQEDGNIGQVAAPLACVPRLGGPPVSALRASLTSRTHPLEKDAQAINATSHSWQLTWVYLKIVAPDCKGKPQRQKPFVGTLYLENTQTKNNKTPGN